MTVHEYALSETTGSVTLYVPFYRGYMYDGLASLDRNEAAEWLRGRLRGFRESALDIREATVRVTTLDSFELEPDFIKIDVQGLEAAVLRGAADTLSRSRPVLLVEASGAEIQCFLESLGYEPWNYTHGDLRRGPGSSPNTFYLHRSTS